MIHTWWYDVVRRVRISVNAPLGLGSDASVRIIRRRDGNGSVGHESNGSPFLDGSRGSRVIASDPLAHDDEITVQYLAIFVYFVGIKNCSLTQLVVLS